MLDKMNSRPTILKIQLQSANDPIIADDESMTDSEISSVVVPPSGITKKTPNLVSKGQLVEESESQPTEQQQSIEVIDWQWDEDHRRALSASHHRTMLELEPDFSSFEIDGAQDAITAQREKTEFHPLMGFPTKEEDEVRAREERKRAAKQTPLKRGFIWDLIQRWMPKFLLLKFQSDDKVQSHKRKAPVFNFHFKPPDFKFKKPDFKFKPLSFQNPFRPRAATMDHRQPAAPTQLPTSPRRLPTMSQPSSSKKERGWLFQFGKPKPVEDPRKAALQQACSLRDSMHNGNLTTAQSSVGEVDDDSQVSRIMRQVSIVLDESATYFVRQNSSQG